MAETTDILFYADGEASPPLEWLLRQPPKVQDKFTVLIKHLAANGSMLRRPYASPLRDKIYELRARHQRVNYRLLYFFHDRGIAIVAHGCTKEKEVDGTDIDRAVYRRSRFIEDPDAHTYRDCK